MEVFPIHARSPYVQGPADSSLFSENVRVLRDINKFFFFNFKRFKENGQTVQANGLDLIEEERYNGRGTKKVA